MATHRRTAEARRRSPTGRGGTRLQRSRRRAIRTLHQRQTPIERATDFLGRLRSHSAPRRSEIARTEEVHRRRDKLTLATPDPHLCSPFSWRWCLLEPITVHWGSGRRPGVLILESMRPQRARFTRELERLGARAEPVRERPRLRRGQLPADRPLPSPLRRHHPLPSALA